MAKRIGFISTRFAGADGVTLEANKWAEVLERAGINAFGLQKSQIRTQQKVFMFTKAVFNWQKYGNPL